LKSYRQVTLAPGEQRSVEIELPVGACTFVNADGVRVVEPGAFELLVGPSSRDEDLLRAGFTVQG
jgi:beta-glucosidase